MGSVRCVKRAEDVNIFRNCCSRRHLARLWPDGVEPRALPAMPLSGQRTDQKPRRSRANLRPRSRSASVIDRLLKNQNPLENRNNHRSSSQHPVLDRRPGNRAAILRSEIHRHGSHGCSNRRCSVRAFDDSTARRSAAAASRGPRLDASRSSTLFSRG